MRLPKKAIALTGLMVLGALASVGYALSTMQPVHDYRPWILLAVAAVTARLKVKLPGLTGNMSVNLPFLLVAVAQLSLLEALMVALPSCAVQCFPKGGGKPKLMQVLFNLSTMAVAVAAANLLGARYSVLGAAGFFLAQTVPVASIIHVTEGGALHRVWCSIAHYSFPFYVLSAGMASITASFAAGLNWQIPLLGLPVLYAIYRSYQSYFRLPGMVRVPSAEAQ